MSVDRKPDSLWVQETQSHLDLAHFLFTTYTHCLPQDAT